MIMSGGEDRAIKFSDNAMIVYEIENFHMAGFENIGIYESYVARMLYECKEIHSFKRSVLGKYFDDNKSDYFTYGFNKYFADVRGRYLNSDVIDYLTELLINAIQNTTTKLPNEIEHFSMKYGDDGLCIDIFKNSYVSIDIFKNHYAKSYGIGISLDNTRLFGLPINKKTVKKLKAVYEEVRMTDAERQKISDDKKAEQLKVERQKAAIKSIFDCIPTGNLK